MYTPESLLDHVAAIHKCKTGVALAELLRVQPPVISKIRHHTLDIGATLMITIHELPAMELMPFKDMRAMIGEKLA
jgi:hypothetical protein